jgi:hypothetical protein
MNASVRRGAIVVVLLVSAACGSSVPSTPTGTIQLPLSPSPTPPPATNFPPLSGPSRIFVFDRQVSYPVSNYTTKSRFVLYDNGAFVLQYEHIGDEGYRGGYKEENGAITFDFEVCCKAVWRATGTLQGDALTVRYNEAMQWTDFEDAVYVLRR